MAAPAPRTRTAARATGRAASLRRAQRQVPARDRAEAAWGTRPEVLEGGVTPEEEAARSGTLRRQQVSSAREDADQDEALRQAAISSQGGMATLDKRTGEIKEGIGGASSEEAAKQAKEFRTGARSASKEAAAQNRERRGLLAPARAVGTSRRGSGPQAPGGAGRTGGGRGGLLAPARAVGTGRRGLNVRRRERPGGTEGSPDARSEEFQRRAVRLKERMGTAMDKNAGKLKRLKAGVGAAKDAKAVVKGMGKEMQKFAGVWWVRFNWSLLDLTFGHSIYVIDLTFLIGFMKKYVGFYFPIEIPDVGAEWFYNPGPINPGNIVTKAKKGGKAKVLIVKVFELTAMFWITFLVFLADVMIIALIAVVIAAFLKLGAVGELLAKLLGFS